MSDQMKKVFRASLASLFIVIVGLFVVCSGSMRNVSLEDEFLNDEFLEDDFLSDLETGDNPDDAYKDELLGRLDYMDEGTTSSSGKFSNDFLSDLGDGGSSSQNTSEGFLTPDLFNSMQSEVNELSQISSRKDRVIDSLRTKLSATNSQLASLESSARSRGSSPQTYALAGASDAKVYDSEFGMYYQDALDDFYVRNYSRAITKFQSLIAQGGNSELVDNCQYWIGEAYFAKGNYYQAIAELQQVVSWSNSNKIDDAQLMIGLAFIKLGEMDLAREELNTLVSFSRNTQSAQKARRYLQELDRA